MPLRHLLHELYQYGGKLDFVSAMMFYRGTHQNALFQDLPFIYMETNTALYDYL